jgi:hypothetical protein
MGSGPRGSVDEPQESELQVAEEGRIDNDIVRRHKKEKEAKRGHRGISDDLNFDGLPRDPPPEILNLQGDREQQDHQAHVPVII